MDLNGNLCLGGSGGSGAVTIADGADVTLGAKADAVCGTATGTCSAVQLLKFIANAVNSAIPTGTNSIGQVTANAGTNLNTSALALDASVGTTNTDLGPPGATACATDTGSCSINALEQRIAQRLTSVLTALGSPFQAGGALAANQSVNVAQVNGVTTSTGTGAVGTGTQRIAVGTDTATVAGTAPVKGGIGVVNGGSTYQAVAASQTATALQTSTGAIGDYLSHCVIFPTSTSPGVVTVFDNTNTAANSAILFAGGASSTSNLTPISVPVGAVSVNGAWKVTTGASVSVVCYGKFS
jgi:hypothetical protein